MWTTIDKLGKPIITQSLISREYLTTTKVKAHLNVFAEELVGAALEDALAVIKKDLRFMK